MFNYAQSAATALRLIQNFGGSLPIKRTVATPNAVEGSVEEETTEGVLNAVVLPANSTKKQAVIGTMDDATLNAAMVKGHVRFVLAAAKGATIVPQPDDTVTFESTAWTVLGVTPLCPVPGGIVLIYSFGIIKT